MIIYTDSTAYAERFFSTDLKWKQPPDHHQDPNIGILIDNLYHDKSYLCSMIKAKHRWKYLFIVEDAPSSQYDTLIQLSQENVNLPDGILCLAGSGGKFHGQHGRQWIGLPGNLHLTVFLAPNRKIDRFGVGFTVLSAISVVETIDGIEGLTGHAGIKWVNDILIDGAKVSGFLTHTQSVEETVTAAVLGFGLNVETSPEVVPDEFVPKVASLLDFVPNREACNLETVLGTLLYRLDENYHILEAGNFGQNFDLYRDRSVIIGREVKILSDSAPGDPKEIAAGVVTGIGENLELFIEGYEKPISKGRLALIV